MYDKYKETKLFNGCSFKFKVYEVLHNQSVIRLHWHDYPEILYFVSGSALLNIGTNAYETKAGDIFFVNPKQPHSAYSINNSMVKYYAVVVDQSVLMGDLHDQYYCEFIMPYVTGVRQFPVHIGKKDAHYRTVRNQIKRLISEFTEKQPGYELKIRTHLYSLVVDLFRGYLPAEAVGCGDEKPGGDEKNIKDLILHIYLTGSLKMTVKEAADYVRLSPYYFCKIFKKTTGQTFIEFLNVYKINLAEEFLLYTPDTVSNIAGDLGFCNIGYFNKVFKQVKGYSPSAFRKLRNGGA